MKFWRKHKETVEVKDAPAAPTKLVVKDGFLSEGGSALTEGKLYLYPNGICIVKTQYMSYLATKKSEAIYALDHYKFQHFFITE